MLSIIPNAAMLRPPVSIASPITIPSRDKATLRCPAENSSAKIVINNLPVRFVEDFNLHPLPIIHRWPATGQPFSPFNYGHAVGLQKIFQAGGTDLFTVFQAV